MFKTMIVSFRENFQKKNDLFGDDFLRTLCKTLDLFFVDVDCHKEGEKFLAEKYYNEVKQNDLYQ